MVTEILALRGGVLLLEEYFEKFEVAQVSLALALRGGVSLFKEYFDGGYIWPSHSVTS